MNYSYENFACESLSTQLDSPISFFDGHIPYPQHGIVSTHTYSLLLLLKNGMSSPFLTGQVKLDSSIDFSILTSFYDAKFQEGKQIPNSIRFDFKGFDPLFKGKQSLHGFDFASSGSSKAQELAQILIEFQKALNLNYPLQDLVFSFTNDNDFLLDIAKIRAFRYLYQNLLSLHNRDYIQPKIHVIANPFLITSNEKWMNLSRQIHICFSALGCNADYIHLSPHEEAFPQVSDLSLATSNNVFHILYSESHLGRVWDPFKGSFTVELLSKKIAESAWNYFLKAQTDSAFLRQEVKLTQQKKVQDFKEGKLQLVGTNLYNKDQIKSYMQNTLESFL